MKSLRLSPDLGERLREAARLLGVSQSDLMRQAIAQRCDQVLEDRLDRQLADLLGVVKSTGGRARDAHRAFTKELGAQRRGKISAS